MKLEPTAKPVKIRITAGGEEHNSLESLSRCFVWSDIQKLLEDGILVKWLKRFDDFQHTEKATQLENLAKSKLSPLAVYNILYGESVCYNAENEVFASFKDENDLMSLVMSLLEFKSIDELFELKDRYIHMKTTVADFLATKNFSHTTSDATLFKVGKFLYAFNSHKKTGENCILYAAQRGLREAQDFKNKELRGYKSRFETEELRAAIFKRLGLRGTLDIIRKSWDNKKEIPMATSDFALKYLYDFSNNCMKIANAALSSDTHPQTVAETHFGMITSGDPLYQEKKFILALFTRNSKTALGIMESINYYPPAKDILRNFKIGLKPECTYSSITFVLGKHTSNAKVLRSYLLNLQYFAKI